MKQVNTQQPGINKTGIHQEDNGPFIYAVYFDGKLVARALDLDEAYIFFRFYAATYGASL